MKIENVAVTALRLPPATPWEDATNKVQNLELVIVEVRTTGGLVGTGFTYTVDIGGTAMKTLLEDYLAPLVIGMDARDYERIWNRLQRQSRRLGVGVNAMAIAAIDIGVWDLVGKHCGQPLYRLLGGAREQISAYVSEVNLAAADRVDDLAGRVDDYLARGYRAIKIKIGRDDFEEDLERLAAVKKRLGRRGAILVDLNQKWAPSEGLAKGAELDRFGLGWIEEPFLWSDIPSHVALKRAIRTPIALGESLYGRHQVLDYLRADAVDFVQADVCFVGGITEWMKIAHLAQAFGKPVAPHFMMELSLHLLCGVQNAFMLEDVVGGSLTELGLLEEPIVVADGIGRPSERPGHGIVFDRAALKAHVLEPGAGQATFAGGSK